MNWQPISECPKAPDTVYLLRGKFKGQLHDEIVGPAIAEWYEGEWFEWLGGHLYGTGLGFIALEFIEIPK